MIKAYRYWTVSFLSLAFFVFVATRLGYLQIYCHASLLERAQREQSRHEADPVVRGAILDRDGRILAMSIEGGSCYADPHLVKERDKTARLLEPLLRIPASALRGKLAQRKRFVWLARRLDPETAHRVQDLHLAAIHVEPEMKRFYPEDSLASQVLGVVGADHRGLAGVEQIADGWLRGESTPFSFKQWSFDRKTATNLNARWKAPAHSVVLTLDRTLQYIAEQELAAQMALSHPRSGTVIIQDPRTGDILAMATSPTYNPNRWGETGSAHENDPELLKNPGVEKVMEPGSTFKLVTAAAALEQQVVKPGDSFYCENGVWTLQGRTIHDHERDSWLTFTEVLSHSSNIGTAKVALKVGQDALYRYARSFGFGIPTGCGLPGDGAGILRAPRQWSPTSLATIAFGQEVGTTPLQMVNAYSVVANGGFLLEPRIFKGVIDEKGEYHEWIRGKTIRRVVSPKTVSLLRMILKRVVDEGTGKAASVKGLSVAGKTGTAQKIDPKTHQYSPDRYLASFCGFAPVENPRLVVGIFLDEPQGSYWGGSEAAPLFSRIVHDAAPYLHLETSTVGPVATLNTRSRT